MASCFCCTDQRCCKELWVLLTPDEAKRLPVDWYGWGIRAAVLPKKASGECVFLDVDGKCEIYSARPQACRDYNCE